MHLQGSKLHKARKNLSASSFAAGLGGATAVLCMVWGHTQNSQQKDLHLLCLLNDGTPPFGLPTSAATFHTLHIAGRDYHGFIHTSSQCHPLRIKVQEQSMSPFDEKKLCIQPSFWLRHDKMHRSAGVLLAAARDHSI